MRIADAEQKPTQEVLGKLFDDVGRVAHFSEGLVILIATDPATDCILALANEIEEKLKAIRAVVHDLVEWVV